MLLKEQGELGRICTQDLLCLLTLCPEGWRAEKSTVNHHSTITQALGTLILAQSPSPLQRAPARGPASWETPGSCSLWGEFSTDLRKKQR